MTNAVVIKLKLEQGGFDGLYAPGVCACLKEDLAPCGSLELDDSGWINECRPGFRHNDLRPGHESEWAVSDSKTPMTGEDFDGILV